MKTIPIEQADGKLGQLIAEACRGERIVLIDGERKVTLEPGMPLDIDRDSVELENELMKAAIGPFTAYSSEEMRAACAASIRSARE